MTDRLDALLRRLDEGRPAIMGVLNVTPDSFSDGGEHLDPRAAIDHARRMIAQGADLLDLGAESTRPGSARVGADAQIERLAGVLGPVAALGVPVSIDTTRQAVARFALDAGADMVNDVSAGRDDVGLLPLVARREAGLILMHMLGEPKTMQADPRYDDVVGEVCAFLAERLAAAEAAGVRREACLVDPGIGFGKRLEHNLALLGRGVEALSGLGAGVVIGASRKRFIGELTGVDAPGDRAWGTVGACLVARRHGARVFRVHDVGALRQALTVAEAIEAWPAEPA